MKICLLMGSPLRHGNTAAQVRTFMEEAARLGLAVDEVFLHDLRIAGCQDCRSCQQVTDRSGCAVADDMQAIYPLLEAADCVVLATPIFTWFCTAPMKAVLDRLFCETKYDLPDGSPGKYRLGGKPLALVTSCGDPVEEGTDLLEQALQRLCTYGRLRYVGMLAQRDIHGLADFTDDKARYEVCDFVQGLIDLLS